MWNIRFCVSACKCCNLYECIEVILLPTTAYGCPLFVQGKPLQRLHTKRSRIMGTYQGHMTASWHGNAFPITGDSPHKRPVMRKAISCGVNFMTDHDWAQFWAHFLSLVRSKLRLCSANHRPGYWSNLPCDWPSTAWAYSEQETENRPWSNVACLHPFHVL